MKAWEEYAFIQEGKVKHIACFALGEYTLANDMSHDIFGEDAFAINVTQIPVQEGDDYSEENHLFYRDGKVVMPLPTDEEEIAINKIDIADLNNAVMELAEIIGG